MEERSDRFTAIEDRYAGYEAVAKGFLSAAWQSDYGRDRQGHDQERPNLRRRQGDHPRVRE